MRYWFAPASDGSTGAVIAIVSDRTSTGAVMEIPSRLRLAPKMEPARRLKAASCPASGSAASTRVSATRRAP